MKYTIGLTYKRILTQKNNTLPISNVGALLEYPV